MARDPYRYYRIEARELLDGLARGVLLLEKEGAGSARAGELLRLAHTLKGAARVVQQVESAEAAHRFEELLLPFRDGALPPREVIDALLAVTDAVRGHLEALDAPPAAAAVPGLAPVAAAKPPAAQIPERPAAEAVRPAASGAAAAPVDTGRFNSVRIGIADMDELLEDVTEAGVQVVALQKEAAALGEIRRLAAAVAAELRPRTAAGPISAGLQRARSMMETLQQRLEQADLGLNGGLDSAATSLGQLRERTHSLRLLPASTIFDGLERAARDAAAAAGKTIEFVSLGGEHRLDHHVLGPLADALLHVVRNAADHGIEPPAQRRGAGKAEAGRIEVSVARDGGRLRFTCSDDGRGLDLDSIRAATVRSGKLSLKAAQGLDLDGAIHQLLQGGLSTAEKTSEISGRGVGLDTVREIAGRLKGRLRVSSTAGQGTRIEISVPLSLTTFSALVVESGSLRAAVALDAVQRTARIPAAAVARTSEGAWLEFDGRILPFAALEDLLPGIGGQQGPREHWTVLAVAGREGTAALGVERMLGCHDILVRPPPAVLGNLPLVAGFSLDAGGDPQPVLDADGVVAAALKLRSPSAPIQRGPARVLVIDDSLTTRMLEQSILESAGYEVTLATSGDEGLRIARAEGRFDLFISDIEMPGMDGFSFVAQTRADPALRETPAILVSSRASPDDRRRGRDVGAHAYIVKGEFDQAHFLDTIRRLVGQ